MAELDWQRVRELFDAAVERPAADRANWLTQTCGNDQTLRAEVERLLEAHGQMGEFIETPALAQLPPLAQLEDQPTLEWTGERFGPYQVVRELGRGGMGVVYLAERADGEFDKQVAIKLLPSGADAQARQRFRRERQILADLEHPNIARLLDGGTLNQQPYVVMEFVPGQSLRQLLREQRRFGSLLPLAEVNAIVGQVCAGLAEAHAHGIIHRDIKPENLIVAYPNGDDGPPLVKILDFGIAKLQQQTNTASTQTAVILGTVSYMSPEQAAGAGQAEVDARADLYSLGMVIYEMLTGAPAFAGDSHASVISQHLYAKPAPPHKAYPELAIPPAVSAVVMKALSKAPSARQRNALQLADEFGQAVGQGHWPGKTASRWRTIALSAVAGLALLIFTWAAVVWNKRPAASKYAPVIPLSERLATNSSTPLEYRIFKKTSAGQETVILASSAEVIVRPNDAIQFEFSLPFSGYCYLFYEGRDKLVWLNPRPGKPPQHANAGEPLRVPEGVWLPFEADDPRNQIFIVVYVPDGIPWALEDVFPAEEQERQLKADVQTVNFPYTPIPQPFAGRLMRTLEENARPAIFASKPVNSWYAANMPQANGRPLISHKVELWHRLN